MKKHIPVAMIALACLSAHNVVSAADSCKPDISGQDRITKKQTEQWELVLNSTGILSAALMDNDLTIWAMVGRYGDINKVSIQIQKKEQSLARAAFESQYHAAKGDQIIFGFKNGEPLSFVATEASNQSRAGSIVENLSSPVLVMTVVMSAIVPDKDLAAFRAALTTKQIDVVRIAFSSGPIDISVKEKISRKLMEKFGCFYQSLDKRGIDLSAGAGSQSQAIQPSPVSEKGGVASVQLTMDQVIQMATVKLPDDIIIKTIQNSSSKFELTPEALIKLKTAGVGDTVIRAMTQGVLNSGASNSPQSTNQRTQDGQYKPALKAAIDEGAASPERIVPFRTGESIPLGIIQDQVTITSVEITSWPKPEALQKAEGRPDQMASLTIKITNANKDKKAWKCRYRVEILDDKGVEIGSREWSVSLGGSQKADTNRETLKMRALDFPRASKLRIKVL